MLSLNSATTALWMAACVFGPDWWRYEAQRTSSLPHSVFTNRIISSRVHMDGASMRQGLTMGRMVLPVRGASPSRCTRIEHGA